MLFEQQLIYCMIIIINRKFCLIERQKNACVRRYMWIGENLDFVNFIWTNFKRNFTFNCGLEREREIETEHSFQIGLHLSTNKFPFLSTFTHKYRNLCDMCCQHNLRQNITIMITPIFSGNTNITFCLKCYLSRFRIFGCCLPYVIQCNHITRIILFRKLFTFWSFMR